MIVATAMNSWTKSRSLTASIELSKARARPSRVATVSGSRPRVDVAVAPAPSAETAVRSAHCDHRSRSRTDAQACASRWWPRVTGWANRAWVVPGITVASCSDARSSRVRPSDRSAPSIRSPLARSHSRRSVTTRSLRDRPACSLAPRSPSRSVTARSTIECTSSSSGSKRDPPVRQVRADLAESLDQPLRVAGVEQARIEQRTDVRDRRRDIERRQSQVVVRRPAQGLCLGSGRAREPPRPQRRTGAVHASPERWTADHTFNGMP